MTILQKPQDQYSILSRHAIQDAVFFTGNSNRSLATDIVGILNERLTNTEISTFSDGEIRIELNESVRGQDAYIIQSTCHPANDNLMELLILADALRRSTTNNIHSIIPYFGYARQDRRPGFSRVSITSKLVANLIQTAGINSVTTVDIHSTQQQGFFDIPSTNISAAPIFVSDIWKKFMGDPKTLTIVSPDIGGVARARSISKQLDHTNLAIVDKRRFDVNMSVVMNIIGEVDGQHCVMIDDMVDTAGTLCKAATALKLQGALSVTAYCTHPVLSGSAYETIANSDLDELVVTDTIPLQTNDLNNIRVLSMAPLIAETIRRMNLRQSISEIYTDC